jgi:hypothetical protein
VGLVHVKLDRFGLQLGRIPEERRVLSPGHLLLAGAQHPTSLQHFIRLVDELLQWIRFACSNDALVEAEYPVSDPSPARSIPARSRDSFNCRPNTHSMRCLPFAV